MKKKFLFTLLPLLLLSSCGTKSLAPLGGENKEVSDTSFHPKGGNISEIRILNIPNYKVPVGYLSYAGIEIEAIYLDGSLERLPFSESLLPFDQLEVLKKPGKKRIDFLFKNNHVYFDVTLVEADVPIVHKVSFYSKEGALLDEQSVPYLGTAAYQGPEIEDYIDGDHYYYFSSWDHELDYVFSDFGTKPIYQAGELEDYASLYDHPLPIVKKVDTGYDWSTLFYLGEMRSVALFTSESKEHRRGYNDLFDASFTADESTIQRVLYDKMYDLAINAYRPQVTSTYSFGNWSLTDGYFLYLNTMRSSLGYPEMYLDDIDDAFKQDFTRYDGRKLSYQSIFESVSSIAEDFPHSSSTMIYDDFPTGNYHYRYVVDIDFYLHSRMALAGSNQIAFERSELYVSLLPGSGRFELIYENEEHAIKENAFSFTLKDFSGWLDA